MIEKEKSKIRNKHSIMKSILTFLVLAILITSCNSKTDSTNMDIKENVEVSELNFIHTVYFWLKDEVTNEQKEVFESGLYELGKAPSIGKFFIGIPAKTDRDVIDSSYDYAWIVHFANGEDQAMYQTDSIHLNFIEKFNALWEKVIVYDSELLGKSE